MTKRFFAECIGATTGMRDECLENVFLKEARRYPCDFAVAMASKRVFIGKFIDPAAVL